MHNKPGEVRRSNIQTLELDDAACLTLLDSFRWNELLESVGIDPEASDQMPLEQRDRAVALAMELRNLHRRDTL